ncbi:hypothetical protein GF360_03850 [candidate division WWE3 bacterium]|nr:hypothetical protein [candidate division WWE3 bacterium]
MFCEKTTLAKIHQSQLDMMLPKVLLLNACGIASMVQVLNYFNKLDKSPEDLFLDFVEFGKYTRPLVNVIFPSLPGIKIPYAPVLNTMERGEVLEEVKAWSKLNSQRDNIKGRVSISVDLPTDITYLPTFSIKYGTDSRGMKSFLTSKGLDVSLYEYTEGGIEGDSLNHTIMRDVKRFVKTLQKFLSEGELIVVSLRKSAVPYLNSLAAEIYGSEAPELEDTHLVTLKQIEGKIYVVDPLVRDSREAIRCISPSHLLEGLTGDRFRSRFLVVKGHSHRTS